MTFNGAIWLSNRDSREALPLLRVLGFFLTAPVAPPTRSVSAPRDRDSMPHAPLRTDVIRYTPEAIQAALSNVRSTGAEGPVGQGVSGRCVTVFVGYTLACIVREIAWLLQHVAVPLLGSAVPERILCAHLHYCCVCSVFRCELGGEQVAVKVYQWHVVSDHPCCEVLF